MREAIIQTSLELGSQLGEEGLTMRGIASRLGVSATALYQHFESKTSILREIRVYGIDLLYEALEPALTIDDPVERLGQIIHRYIEFARANKWLYSVLMEHDQIEWSELSEDEVLRTLRPLRAVQDSMVIGAERGVWRDGVNPQVVAFQLWASVHGLCSLLNNGRFDEKHPVFPIPDETSLIDVFADGMVRALKR